MSLSNGDITATDAIGSIVGVVKSRHFPENVDEVLKNWAALVQDCARRQQLDVRGAVGGGWTVYTPDDDAEDGYQTSAVGYAESFYLSFPISATPEGTIGFELLTTSNSIEPALALRVSIQALARAASSGYVEAGLACSPSKLGGASCGSRVVMLELQSLTYNTLPQYLASGNESVVPSSSIVVSAVGILIVGVAAKATRHFR